MTRQSQISILSHRACLQGPGHAQENRLDTLAQAISHGFSVEFDINFNAAKTKLVLSHDPAEWSPEQDALAFLAQPGAGTFHALNVKSLFTLTAICRAMEQAGAQNNFFFFDFELLTDDLAGCRYQMRSLQETGFSVAYRLSEREPFLKDYLQQDHVQRIWLDEFCEPWVRQEHLLSLLDKGKQVVFVSPDLHGRRDPDTLKRRWEQLVTWGVTGICTDYPIFLKEFLGGIS
jgi:hypothetical protein